MTRHHWAPRQPGFRRAFVARFLLPFLVYSATPAAHAATVTISALKDNTLFLTNDGSLSSGAGPYFFAGSNGSLNVRRGVIAFDLAAVIPAGASIDSVALVLNVSSAPNDTPQAVELHRLLADWGEGTSVSSGGAGAVSTPGDATWLHRFYPNLLWSNPGGDFDAAVSASQVVGVSGPHVWSGPAMAADVQAWLNQPAGNFGWLVQGAEATASSVRRFDSRENTMPENRPYLFVRYTQSNAAKVATWGAVKSLYRAPGSE